MLQEAAPETAPADALARKAVELHQLAGKVFDKASVHTYNALLSVFCRHAPRSSRLPCPCLWAVEGLCLGGRACWLHAAAAAPVSTSGALCAGRMVQRTPRS